MLPGSADLSGNSGKEKANMVSEVRKGRGPGKKPKKVVTTVQFDPDVLEGLQRVAEREERTVSAVIRLAVREYLERENV